MRTSGSMIKRFVRHLLMLSPPLWLKVRAWRERTCDTLEPEIDLLRFLVDPNRTAIDVGANDGTYTYRLLDLAKNVVSVEPNPACAKELLRLFGYRIRLINAAVSDKSGTVDLSIPIGDSEKPVSALATIEPENTAHFGPCKTVTVVMKTIDELAIENVGFIKVDVEGHEDYVLAGAEQTIRRHHPVLLIEAENRHRAGAVEMITKRLTDLGYVGLYLSGGVLRPLASFDPAIHQSAEVLSRQAPQGRKSLRYVNNFIFIPANQAV